VPGPVVGPVDKLESIHHVQEVTGSQLDPGVKLDDHMTALPSLHILHPDLAAQGRSTNQSMKHQILSRAFIP
jgi:hypothetical protein